jgi:hypothetical protein
VGSVPSAGVGSQANAAKLRPNVGSSDLVRRGILCLEMPYSVETGIALDAAVRSHAKRQQHISLDETTPMRTKDFPAAAMRARKLEGSVH